MKKKPVVVGGAARVAAASRSATPSALLLRLVQRARWLWLHWIEQRWAAFGRWRADRRAAKAARAGAAALARRPDRLQIETLEPKLLLSADLLPADASQAALPTITQTLDAATAAALTAPVDMQLRAYDWKSHALLAGVSITPAGGAALATDAAGLVTLPGLSNDTTALTVARAVPGGEAAATAQAVNLQDAISVLRLVVGLDINPAGQALSPYQAIAADFDANGSVQLADAIGVLRNVVGLPGDAPRWAFLDEADTGAPARASLNPGLVADTVTVLSEAQGGLVAVLRGDVDGSWTPPLGSNTLDSAYFNGLVSKVNERAGSIVLSGSAWGVNPSLLRLNLDSASDTAPLGDMVTDAATVTLTGRTQAGVALALRQGDTLVAQATADANGAFSFANLALTVGANAYTLTLTNTAQASSTASVLVQRGAVNLNPPTLSAALRNDTGTRATDGITRDATVDGTVQADAAVAQLLAVLDPADANAAPTNITDLLGAGEAGSRSFSITPERLALLAGGTLADGAHTLRLVAVDDRGLRSPAVDLQFTLDSLAPSAASVGIAAVDAVAGNDAQTSAAIALLRGTAEPGTTVTLAAQGLATVASQTGSFQIPGVAFASGDNPLTVTVTDVAGNSQTVSKTFSRVVQDQADAVLVWNDIALRAIQRDVTDPPVATRNLALVSLAQYDTLAAIEGTPAFLVQRSVSGDVNALAAVATAAHRILSLTYPAQQAVFDTALASSLAGLADGAAKDAGITLGLSVADAVLAVRADDGSGAFTDDSGSTAVGRWRPTGPMYEVAENPHWGNVRPFALTSPSALRPAAPPAVDTAAYADALNEIKALGSATSTTRTADQTEQAHFWADGKGSTTPPGHWNQIASQVALASGNSLSANARLFAQLNVALADAAIACWDAKYFYDAWRPETAIQNADLDNNAATAQDAAWRSLLINPSHPDYVSGHSTFSAAAAAVLARTFGDDTAFTTTSATLPGVTRSFTSFSQAAGESGRSRVYGGIHFEYANQAGQALGQAVAQAVLDTFALTQDTQAPTVAMYASPAATNTNLTLTGQVLDNLSGVSSASWRIDGGAAQALSLGADGSFSITTGLATDGSADGSHTITITATDAAGNVSAAASRSFTLDTVAPAITLTSLAEGATLAAGSRISGSANPNGSTLTQLGYTIDGGPTQTLIFDASGGSFDAPLDFGSLTVGDHTIALTARDAAGNATTLTRTVTVDALAPFTLVGVTPGEGSSDVGVTQRPIVSFSRAVNPATLNADSLYATGPDGSKLAATIVPASDGTFAWLFFTSPMPGASRITVTVDGSKVRAAADGSFLDADGNGTAGGSASVSFTTVSTTVVSGTTLKGKVVDPGADLEPMTFDDVRRGADGVIHTDDDVFLNPIAGARVWILGQEQNVVFTDAGGNFTLTNVPTGNVKVAIDGRTATNAPTGVFWPEMVMDATLRPGTENTLMSSMGSREEQAANTGRPEVYLPRVATSVLQDVSSTEATVITVDDAAAAPALTAQERAAMTLTVQPGSAIGEDGQALQDVQIGIATVPAELVRDMLPPGVLQHTFDITIQAPGVAAFAEPVQITFPNVFNAAPGTKLNILSFDHTTGRLVINGTGTVSADGLTVTSDQDSGVRAPGWHGMTPPGSQSETPCREKSAVEKTIDVVGVTKDILKCLAELNKKLHLLVESVNIVLEALSLGAKLAVETSNLIEVLKTGSRDEKSDAIFKEVKILKDGVRLFAEAKLPSVLTAINTQKALLVCLNSLLGVMSTVCGYAVAEAKCATNDSIWDSLWDFTVQGACTAVDVAKIPVQIAVDLVDEAEHGLAKLGVAVLCAAADGAIALAENWYAQPERTSPGVSSQLQTAASSEYQIDVNETTTDQVILALEAILSEQRALETRASDMTGPSNQLIELAQAADFPSDSNFATPISEFVELGFGLPENGYYVAEFNGTATRGQFGYGGALSLLLPASTEVAISFYDPKTNLHAQVNFVTAQAGATTNIPVPRFQSLVSTEDFDKDGLVDIAENIIGSRVDVADTDGDGLSDGAEATQGLDALGGRAIPTGVVAIAEIAGTALAVETATLIGTERRSIGLVAGGALGLSTIDLSQSLAPRVSAQVDLPGVNVDVAADKVRGIAALAAMGAGLNLVSISDPVAPRLLQTVSLGDSVQRVAAFDGVAYAAHGIHISAVNMQTGEVLQKLVLGQLGGSTITDLAIDGSILYVMDANNVLRAIDIADGVMTAQGAITLPNGGGKLFVGGGVAYVGTTSTAAQGYLTVDVSDPADLRLLSDADAVNIVGQSLVANGSGLLVSTGQITGPQGQAISALDVTNVSDPTNTGNFVTRINLPAAPQDVVLANGMAFVATGAGGLQVVNFIGFDNKGVAPTVSFTLPGADIDPATAGIQAQEGRTLRVAPTVSDDVQVRSVELLVNGQVVASDVSFPFDLLTTVPAIATSGNSFTVQVRATDTGGNVGLSDTVTVNVVADTFGPQVRKVSLADGASLFFVRSVDITFDEPIDLALFGSGAVSLVRVGSDGAFGTADDVPVAVRLDSRVQGQVVSTLPDGFLSAGQYRLTVDAAQVADRVGNRLTESIVRQFTVRPASEVRAAQGAADVAVAPSANPLQEIGVPVGFDPLNARMRFVIGSDTGGVAGTQDVGIRRIDAERGIAYFVVPVNAVSGDVSVFSQVGGLQVFPEDGSFPLQIVPVVTDVQVESVAADGSSAIVWVYGMGFTDGDAEYRFGDTAVPDGATNEGPDVVSAGQAVRLTLPLSGGAFGGVSVKTAGGVSGVYTVSLAGVQAVALSGTPADAGVASANAGQTVKLLGAGLTLGTDVLLKWVNHVGGVEMLRLNPTQVSADGTSAQLDLPAYVNGVLQLQVLGSASQPLLQIVPTIQRVDIQDRIVLFGSGYIEGASTYTFAGNSHSDALIDAQDAVGTVNVWYDGAQNNSVYIQRAAIGQHGLGTVTVSTAGGTSAAFDLNVIRVDVAGTSLGDLAVDASGTLWVLDYGNPGKLQRIDRGTGAVLQSIDMTEAWGTPYTVNHAGLQVLGQAMTLGSTEVPAGSLLVFNGHPNPDLVVAIDPASGAVIASRTLGGNHDLTGGVFDASTGSLLVLAYHSNDIKQIDPASGAVLASIALPAGANIQAHAGIAINPLSGHLWVGGYYQGGTLFEIDRDGTLLRTVDLSRQLVNNAEVSGLAFDADGQLLVASTQGVIYKVDPNRDWAATQTARLDAVIGLAGDGTPADGAQASANVGEVIELRGANFNAGTSVLFRTRDAAGTTSVVAVNPLLISPDGTRLQVRVPDLATTGDVRVVNRGLQNLGFFDWGPYGDPNWADSIYRQVTVSFTAQPDGSASIRFTDGGLEDLSNESWGIDNVVVRNGAAQVFADDFEAGAKANWSNTTTDNTNPVFTRFSGRFGNTSQTLSLSGLSAGQTYTLDFDLYAIDSWEGNGLPVSYAPDVFKVIIDGQELLSESLANHPQNGEQTLRASQGIRLQVVPKLQSVTNSRPGQDDWYFFLNGSGFMEGATTVTVGGVVSEDRITNDNPIDIDGAANNRLGMVAPRSLDGPIRVATDGGWDEIAGFDFGPQPVSVFTGITASATAGQPQATGTPSAVTGQTIQLTGQGMSNSTLVQFRGIDDAGRVGILTRTGSWNGTTLSVVVPALAAFGPVTVLGSNTSFDLQIVPTLKGVGGVIAAGNTIVLEGTGLTQDDLVISIDARTVGSFNRRTVVDGDGGNPDQQFITLTVPAGVSAGVITVSTAGGQATLRGTAITTSALPALSASADAGAILADAMDVTLGMNESVSITGGVIASTQDVDLYRLQLNAGDQLDLSVTAAGSYTYLRVFDADGRQVGAVSPYFSPGNNAPLRWMAPAAGTYYIGMSGWDFTNYDPQVAGSGTNGYYTGGYTLGIERQAAGSRHLQGITATAASGTPASAGLASANVGQTITLAGNFSTTDRVVFTATDTNGNLFEQVVAPASLDTQAGTLTVQVPQYASTGTLRLERDLTGLILQIVPTISGVTDGGSGSLSVSGSGFVEGDTAVLLPGLLINDPSRYLGTDVNGPASLTALGPVGWSRTSVAVQTTGGTSAAFTP